MKETLPNKFKAEVDSSLENFLTLLVLFYGIITVLITFVFLTFFSRLGLIRYPVFVFFGLHLGAFVVLFLMRRSSSCYFIFNLDVRRIDYYRLILILKKVVPFRKFDNIEAVMVSGLRKRTTRHPYKKWYSYIICLIDKKGEIFDFSRESKDLQNLNASARLMSNIIECKYFECPPEHVVEVTNSSNGPEIKLTHCPISQYDGNNLPYEFKRQMTNLPVIAGAFFGAWFLAALITGSFIVVLLKL